MWLTIYLLFLKSTHLYVLRIKLRFFTFNYLVRFYKNKNQTKNCNNTHVQITLNLISISSITKSIFKIVFKIFSFSSEYIQPRCQISAQLQLLTSQCFSLKRHVWTSFIIFHNYCNHCAAYSAIFELKSWS